MTRRLKRLSLSKLIDEETENRFQFRARTARLHERWLKAFAVASTTTLPEEMLEADKDCMDVDADPTFAIIDAISGSDSFDYFGYDMVAGAGEVETSRKFSLSSVYYLSPIEKNFSERCRVR